MGYTSVPGTPLPSYFANTHGLNVTHEGVTFSLDAFTPPSALYASFGAGGQAAAQSYEQGSPVDITMQQRRRSSVGSLFSVNSTDQA
jgi:hypothetical protein